MQTKQDLYDELAFYTLAHPDPRFIHQHVVDAFAAQYADEETKPIGVVFALVGLFLYVEKRFTGKQVQRVHMDLARRRREWTRPALPDERGLVGIEDVLAAEPGEARDAMIRVWCESVWDAWGQSHTSIRALLQDELGIG
jgi:hypothetical protein